MAAGNGTALVLKSLAWLQAPQGGGVGERKKRRTAMIRRMAAGSGTMLVLTSLARLWAPQGGGVGEPERRRTMVCGWHWIGCSRSMGG